MSFLHEQESNKSGIHIKRKIADARAIHLHFNE